MGDEHVTARVLEMVESVVGMREYHFSPQRIAALVPDGALEAAHDVDDAVRAGRPVGPLAGVPVALKDLIDLAGVPTTAGAHRLFHHTPTTDASVVTRLRSAGAVIVGKTGLHEFAYGVTNINPHTGPVRNPWDLERIPGGSSGGSGAAVAAGFVAAALGTDTGGSIRIPAGLCGVTGFKPTFGRVPVDGVVPLSWTLDHVGPLARTAADAAVVFSVLAQVPEVLAELSRGLTGVRLSVPEEFFWEELDRDVMSCCRDAVRVLTSGGAVQRSTAFPHASECGAAAAVILAAEAAAYHDRPCGAHRGRPLARSARVARAERAVHAIHESIQPSRLSRAVHSVWTESRRLADWFADCRTAVRRRDRAAGRACLPAADGLAQATTVDLELSAERGEQALL